MFDKEGQDGKRRCIVIKAESDIASWMRRGV